MKLQTSMMITVMLLVFAAIDATDALAVENVEGWNNSVPQPFATTQTGFRIRVNGNISGIVSAYDDTTPPSSQNGVSVTYDGGSDITTILFVGTWPQDTTTPIPHFGFDTGFVGGWTVADWAWVENATLSPLPDINGAVFSNSELGWFLDVTNHSTESISINTGGYLESSTVHDISDLGPAGLPPGGFTTFATNVIVAPSTTQSFFVASTLKPNVAVYFELEWASGSFAFTDTVQSWGAFRDTLVPALSSPALAMLASALCLCVVLVHFRARKA